MENDPKRGDVFNMMVKNFSHFAHVSAKQDVDDKRKVDSSDSDDEQPRVRIQGLWASQRQAGANMYKKKKKIEENESSLIADPNKLDLINNLNSMKLIQISEAFDKFPNQQVDVETFVNIMKEILGDSSLVERENFVMELVDLFYRAK